MNRALSIATTLVLLSTAIPAAAQDTARPTAPVRWTVGGNFIVAAPVGEFADFIDTGYGFSFVGHYNLTRVLRIRLDGGYIQYGSESREICLPTCRIHFDLDTTNGIGFGSIGPELMVPAGPIRPYLNAGIGGAYFVTSSHLDGVDDENDIGQTTNFDDGAFAGSVGGGLYIPITMGTTPVSLDLGVRYHRNGRVRYLREGDIQDNPDGSITFTPTRSRADLVTFAIGVSVGIRGRR